MRNILTILFICLSITVSATTYYVSTTGSNDANNGTSPSTPWETLTKVNSFTFSPGDSILFKRGSGWYGSLVISNSGTSGHRITFGAYGTGVNLVINGFTNVTSWTNLGSNIWESTSAVSTLATCKLVLINGVNTPMGAYPNRTSTYPFLPTYFPFQSHTGTGLGATSLTSSSLNATNWTGADVVVRVNHWTLDKETITSQSSKTISYSGQSSGIADNWGFFIQNDSLTLDVQNEWYYNPSTKKIRIYSTSSPIGVQIATVDTLLYSGSRQYLQIDSINFTGANTTAICIPNANYSNIINCTISYTGDIAIDNYGTITGANISNNIISNSGSSAIWGRGVQYTINNNTINNAGLISVTKQHDYTYGAITIGSPATPASNSLVQYNNIDSSGWGGITFRGTGFQVRNNFINHSALIRDDVGGIYTGFANETGKVIDGNIVLNTVGNSRGVPDGTTAGNGIYIDDLGNNLSITNNTVAYCANSGIFLHNANNVNVNNNLVYNCGNSTDYTKGQMFLQNGSGSPYDSSARGNAIKNNILFAKNSYQYAIFYNAANSTNLIATYGTFDSNYYAKPLSASTVLRIDQPGTSTDMSLPTWQSFTSQDVHSTISAWTDTSALKLVYNSAQSNQTISLPGTYVDTKGVSYGGTITLAPYTSAILMYTGIAPIVNAGGNFKYTGILNFK